MKSEAIQWDRRGKGKNMANFDANPPRRIKPWEMSGDMVLRNPDLVSLRDDRTWRPRPYVSYLWVMPDQDNLLVGVETQVASVHVSRGTPPTQQGYGHPTLTGGGSALYGGEVLFKPARGGWLINGASGRYGRSSTAAMNTVRLRQAQRLFQLLIGLHVTVDDYEVRSG